MSLSATRRLLWLFALLTVPVPIWLFEPARVPVVWLAQMAGYGTAMWINETPSITVRVLAAASILQTLLWAGALYLIARIVARRLLPIDWRPVGVAGLVAALVAVALFPIYRTTFVHDCVAVSWLGLFA
jgi:hypothetical protein